MTLVTAVMVTGLSPERRPFALAAARGALSQTHSKLELLIINDGERPLEIADVRAREIMVPRTPRLTLGELRNIGLEEARGDFVTQWDDDDYHHCRRVAHQLKYAREDHAVLLLWQIRYSFPADSGWAMRYDRPKEGIPGTILHPKTKARYPHVGKHEDSRFLNKAFGNRRVILDNHPRGPGPGPELYLRFWHGHNTWHARHVMRQYADRPGRWSMPPACERYVRGILETEYSWVYHSRQGGRER